MTQELVGMLWVFLAAIDLPHTTGVSRRAVVGIPLTEEHLEHFEEAPERITEENLEALCEWLLLPSTEAFGFVLGWLTDDGQFEISSGETARFPLHTYICDTCGEDFPDAEDANGDYRANFRINNGFINNFGLPSTCTICNFQRCWSCRALYIENGEGEERCSRGHPMWPIVFVCDIETITPVTEIHDAVLCSLMSAHALFSSPSSPAPSP